METVWSTETEHLPADTGGIMTQLSDSQGVKVGAVMMLTIDGFITGSEITGEELGRWLSG